MSKFAWVTLTTNDTYSLGALVLAHSLKRAGTAHQLAVLITPSVSKPMVQKLKDVYNVVQEVNIMDSQDAANLALLARPELGVTFTKLHCWRLLQFEKCVFLDSDTLVLQNCDELFDREELSAAPDVSWPDCFNSGVFVYKPSIETFTKITEFALKHGSFDGGDQGLLNSFFADWAHTDIGKHLPFVYNVTAYASYCYLPAFKQFREKIKILHFAGKIKPWLIEFDSQSRTACTPSEYRHAQDLIQLWWNIFCDNVHQNLDDKMPEHKYWPNFSNRIDNWNSSHSSEKKQQEYENRLNQYFECYMNSNVNDPWEDYYANMRNENTHKVVDLNCNENPGDNHENIQTSLDTTNENSHLSQPSIANTIRDSENDGIQSSLTWYKFKSETKNDSLTQKMSFRSKISLSDDEEDQDQNQEFQETGRQLSEKQQSVDDFNEDCLTGSISTEAGVVEVEILDTFSLAEISNENQSIISYLLNNNVACTPSLASNIEVEQNQNEESNNEAGLAGALATLRLGEKRSPEQEAYEQLMRRQCWESGQIDYTGKDSFDNIWKKITSTLESKPDESGESGAQEEKLGTSS